MQEIQQRAKSDDSQTTKAAESAMLTLALFAFFHFDGITRDIFSYAAKGLEKVVDNEQRSVLPLARSMLDCTLLQIDNTGKWDDFVFKERFNCYFLSASSKWIHQRVCIMCIHLFMHGEETECPQKISRNTV